MDGTLQVIGRCVGAVFPCGVAVCFELKQSFRRKKAPKTLEADKTYKGHVVTRRFIGPLPGVNESVKQLLQEEEVACRLCEIIKLFSGTVTCCEIFQ